MNSFEKFEHKVVNFYSKDYECVGSMFLEGYETDGNGFVFEFEDQVIYCSPSTDWNIELIKE